MKKIIFLYFIISASALNAQNAAPFYRQFAFNPYTFNPAFGGVDNQAKLNLVYRKQWINFQDAPTTAGLTFQIPASRRVALGLNVISDEQVLLKNSSFKGSFIYVIPIGEDQTLRFGLSGGVGMNRLNLSADELNTNDPAIAKTARNNFYADGDFGVVYTHHKLNVGFALTDIFRNDPFYPEKFNNPQFSNLRNRLYSVSYRVELGAGTIALEPYFLYHESADALQNYWETAALIRVKQTLWTGAGYNQNKGVALFLGMNIKEKLSFSYSYEFPPFRSSTFNASSHELQMSLKFGKKRSPDSNVPKQYKNYTNYPAKNITENKAPQKTVTPIKPANVARTDSTEGQAVHPANTRSREINTTTKPSAPATSQHYVVVGVFKTMENASAYATELLEEGHYAKIYSSPDNHYYYVNIFSSGNIQEARRMRDEYRKRQIFPNAWILTAE